MQRAIAQTPSQETNNFRIYLMSVPDTAQWTGNAANVFRGSATISDAMAEWLQDDVAPGKFSPARARGVVQGLLAAMQASHWDPYLASSLAHPLRFTVVVDGSLLTVIASINPRGADLLHLHIADSSTN